MGKLKQKWNDLSKKKKIIYGSGAGVLLAGIIVAVIFATSGYYATTMRLLRAEGTVSIEDSNGNSKPIMENARFQSGDAINTGSSSLASIGLDDDKIITLDENSRAEFSKKRKQIELKLTQGGLFFDVQKPLEPDETMDIKTSTMIVGIRGTSGYVFVDDDGRECILVTDGRVHVTGVNPVTGEEKETDVSAGQLVKVYLFYDRTENSVEFQLEIIDEYHIPDFVLARLREDPDLLAKVCEYTGWNADIIMGRIETLETEASESSEESETEGSTEPGETSETSGPTGSPSPSVTVTPGPSGTVTPTTTPRPGSDDGDDDDDDDDDSIPTPAPRSSNTPAPTGSTATPTPRGTTTPVPTSTPRPTSTVAPTSTPRPTSTPVPTSTPEPTPSSVDEIFDSRPEGYEEQIVGFDYDEDIDDYIPVTFGDDEHRVFILWGNDPPDHELAPGETLKDEYIGYIDGSWVKLEVMGVETPDRSYNRYSYNGEVYYEQDY